jgi:hypothetical protein
MLKTILISSLMATSILANTPISNQLENRGFHVIDNEYNKLSIDIAILLDTSGSMQSLINQARAEIWKIINSLNNVTKNGVKPELRVSLFEYGKSSLPLSNGHLQMISPLTTDLDIFSSKLFNLRTNGGDEFAPWVIQDASLDLKWSTNKDSFKLIIIAGNEAFQQGPVLINSASSIAKEKGIIVNSIFCGDYNNGIRSQWNIISNKTDGVYSNINNNIVVEGIKTPYDDELLKLNRALNDTYIRYGYKGKEKREMQIQSDKQASGISKSILAERTVAKASSNYKNDSWDMVDALESGKEFKDIDKSTLEDEYKNISEQELEKIIEEKKVERKNIKEKIHNKNKLRAQFIKEESKKNNKNSFGDKLIKNIDKQIKDKGFKN